MIFMWHFRTPNVPEIANTLVKWLQHPEWKYSDSSTKTAFQLFYKTDLPVFDWVKDQPEIFTPFAEGIRVCIFYFSFFCVNS